MPTFEEGYFKGYKSGSEDGKAKIINAVRGFVFNDEWSAHEIKRALLKEIERQ